MFFHKLQYIFLILPLHFAIFRIVRFFLTKQQTVFLNSNVQNKNLSGTIEENLELLELEVQHQAEY